MIAANAFREFEYEESDVEKYSPDIHELNIISGGCHIYGYLLEPDKRYEGPYPTVIMSHGFPGYTTNNDLELALMRMGLVVIHMNHRGAWGSEGNYLFTNLKDDLIAIAKWAHNPAIAEQYNIDPENIFFIGHSMGGMTVINATKELPFIKKISLGYYKNYLIHLIYQFYQFDFYNILSYTFRCRSFGILPFIANNAFFLIH